MKKHLLIIIITIIAFLIRFYNSQYPPLLWDEASLGYNAYSIIKTGRDEYGQLMPLIFKSFGDYKPGFYVYLSIPFVAIFGLSEMSVRLPSIILGSLLPLVLYLIIAPKNKRLGLVAAALIAFNPWNIHFSRGAWETNVLTFELALAVLFFQKKKYPLSAIIFGLSLYTYQSAKMISLFLIIILFITNWKNFHLKDIFTKFIIPLGILTVPVLYGLIFGSDSNRLQVISLFSYPRDPTEVKLITQESNQINYQVFHQQLVFFLRGFFGRYFNHFSPEFLFSVGDWQIHRHSAPYIGTILYPTLIFFIIGLFYFFRLRLRCV